MSLAPLSESENYQKQVSVPSEKVTAALVANGGLSPTSDYSGHTENVDPADQETPAECAVSDRLTACSGVSLRGRFQNAAAYPA
jgi:hypothetical protein